MAEEQSIIFKSGEGAFDRAGMNRAISSGNAATITPETISKMKSADKAIEAVKSFYNKIYEEEVKKLDPKYDPTEGAYYYAYSEQGSNQRFFKDTIEKGGAIDSVKDVIPRAKRNAESFINNVKQIKEGSVTKVISQIGIRSIKDMDDYDAVRQAFNKEVKNGEKDFDKLLDNFQKILEYYDQPGLTPQTAKILYSPDNNAIIAALATIIKTELKNDNIDKYAGNLEKNLEVLAKSSPEGEKGGEKGGEKTEEKKKEEGVAKVEAQKLETKKEEEKKETQKLEPGKLEAVAGEKKTEDKKEAGTQGVKSEPQKIEESKKESKSSIEGTAAPKETPKDAEKPKGAEAASTPVKMEATAGALTPPAKMEAVTPPSTEAKSIETKAEEKAASVETKSSLGEEKKSAEMVGKGNQGAADFLKDIFGLGGDTGKIESSGASATPSASTKTEATKISEKTKSVEASKGPVLATSKASVEKKSGPSETNKTSAAIKETSPQKLASVSTNPEASKAKVDEIKSTATESGASKGGPVEASSKEEIKSETAEGKPEEAAKSTSESTGDGDLGKKMDLVASLLSQLNETLQGPLIVTGLTKKFE